MRQHRARFGGVRRRRHDLVVPQVHVAQLEQAGRVVQVVHVLAHGGEQPRQQRRAHHRLLDAHGVAQLDRGQTHVAPRQAEGCDGVGRDEGVGDDLVQAAAGQGAPHGAPHLLRLRKPAGRGVPRQRLGSLLVAGDAADLLDEVDLALEVGTEAGGRDRPLPARRCRGGGLAVVHLALEAAEDAGLLGPRYGVPEQAVARGRPVSQAMRRRQLLHDVDRARRDRAVAQLREEPRGEGQAAGHQVRVQSLLEAVARLAADARVHLRAQDARAAEGGGLQHQVRGVLVHLGVDAAEHAGDDEGRSTSAMTSISPSSVRSTPSRVTIFSPSAARRAMSLSPRIFAASKACSGSPQPSIT